MDGVERIMVLGIFAVIVAILGVAAWSVTQDDLGGTHEQQQGAMALAKSEATGPQDLVGDAAAGRGRSAPFSGQPSAQVLQRPDDRGQPKQPELAHRGALPLQTGNPGAAGLRGQDLLAERGAKDLDRTGNGREAIDLSPRGASAPIALRSETQAGSPAVEEQKKDALQLRKPTYTVRKDDTLWSIAAQHVAGSASVKAKLAQVLALNPGLDAERMAVGQVLTLPGQAVAAPAVAPPAKLSSDGASRLYTVSSGDTLSSIAKAHLGNEGRWTELFQLNEDRLSSPSKLYVGQTLRLPQE